MKNEKKVDIEQANKVYFKSLANTRASAAMMINSWTGVFLFAFEILCFYSYDVSDRQRSIRVCFSCSINSRAGTYN